MGRVCGLCLVIGAGLAIGGCSADAGSGDANCDLPGDVDCGDGAGDKDDEWDWVNDPLRIANNLNYRLAELPQTGRSMVNPWAESYWPTYQGSTNYRWQGESTLSPLEKYDAAFHGWTVTAEFATSVPGDCGPDANRDFTRYRQSLGPAAQWMAGAQGRDRMYDGRDNDNDMQVDECGSDYDGIEGWWGLCHAWSPAAILEPEPQHAVEYNGQRFEVSDIKALILTVYDATDSVMLGGRCNARTIEHDDTGRVEMSECRDVNAGAWHVVISNLIGMHQRAFVEDRTGGSQVWNQPLFGYRVDSMQEITFEQANQLLMTMNAMGYPYNPRAKTFFEVRMTTDWLTEGHQSTEPLGTEAYIRHDSYHYVLELDGNGKIIGGEWVGSSRDAHPDFLWVPNGPATGWSRANPNVDLAQVRTLIQLSRADMPEEPTGGTTFENATEQAIPDNDPNGVRSVITVSDALNVAQISVAVNIDHTYRGDLVVALEHEGRSVTLHDQTGGSADDLVQTFTVGDFAGATATGEWALVVSDRASQDTGTLKRFTLTFIGN